MASSPRAQGTGTSSWMNAAPAPVVLVSGPEALLGERAIERIVAAARAATPGIEITRLNAGTYERGALLAAASPSLFAEPSLVIVESAEAMNEEFVVDALAYAAAPDPDVVVVVRHGGGVRGKKVLDALRSAGPEYVCAAVKKDAEFVDFAKGEFERAGRNARASAVRVLVDAVGQDLAELASACKQLADDVEGPISDEVIHKYYGSRVNATGFAVADAAVAGEVGRALALVRHAMATGTDPVPLVAALAGKMRTLAKVGAARGRGVDPAREMGLPPWQVDRARKELQRWNAQGVAEAIEAIAAADAEVKGGGRDPQYAVERAVRVVAGLATKPR